MMPVASSVQGSVAARQHPKPALLEANHAYYQQTLDLVSARHDLARAQARLIELTGRVERFGVAAPPRERSGP